MKLFKWKAALATGLTIISPVVMAYSDCWTQAIDISQGSMVYDASGARYLGSLPAGKTCGCSTQTDTIWFGDANNEKTGTTAALLAAQANNKQIKVYIQQLKPDNYCRAVIIEVL